MRRQGLFTLTEVASWLKMSVDEVFRLVREGKLACQLDDVV